MLLLLHAGKSGLLGLQKGKSGGAKAMGVTYWSLVLDLGRLALFSSSRLAKTNKGLPWHMGEMGETVRRVNWSVVFLIIALIYSLCLILLHGNCYLPFS